MKVRAVKKAIITIKEGEKMDLFEERKKSAHSIRCIHGIPLDALKSYLTGKK